MRKIKVMGHTLKILKLKSLKSLQSLFYEHEERYSDEALRAHGREDGQKNIPRPDSDEPSPFERELLHSAASLASQVAAKYKSCLELIDAKIKAEESTTQQRHKHALEYVEGLAKTEKEASDDNYGLGDAHKQLEITEAQYKSFRERLGRGPIAYIPHWLYVVFATLIFIGEIPLNALVFQIFGENQIMTWFMAFVIGLSIPVSAHFIGIKFREHGEGFSWGNFLKGFVVLGVVVAALYVVSVIRRTYFGEYKDTLGLTENLVESTMLFFWLNLAVLCAAIVVAYLSHDSVPGYQDAEKNYKKCRRALEKREKRRVGLSRGIGLQRIKALNKANEEQRDTMAVINMMKGTYDQILKEGQEHESRCLDKLLKELSIYRHENVRARANAETPKCFSKNPEFPLELSKMKEKLVNEYSSESSHA